jgi:hypothetical protein
MNSTYPSYNYHSTTLSTTLHGDPPHGSAFGLKSYLPSACPTVETRLKNEIQGNQGSEALVNDLYKTSPRRNLDVQKTTLHIA